MATARRGTPRCVRMMAIDQGLEELHEDIPDLVLVQASRRETGPVGLPCGTLDQGGEVPAATELHEDVEDARVAVDHTVVVTDNVLVVEVLEDIHFSDYLPFVPLGHQGKVEVLAREHLGQRGRTEAHDDGRGPRRS
jgi:hypothetical protein